MGKDREGDPGPILLSEGEVGIWLDFCWAVATRPVPGMNSLKPCILLGANQLPHSNSNPGAKMEERSTACAGKEGTENPQKGDRIEGERKINPGKLSYLVISSPLNGIDR